MRRILVIEGDPTTCSLAEELLGILDYEVRTARTGAEALDLLHSAPPDAIIVDLTRPDVEGAALFDALRAEPCCKPIPMLVVSDGGRPSRELAQRYGARYVAKPFDVVSFLASVQELDSQ